MLVRFPFFINRVGIATLHAPPQACIALHRLQSLQRCNDLGQALADRLLDVDSWAELLGDL
jgi:hypothetical protein